MPNYCFNSVHLAHNDPRMIERVITAIKQSKLCEEFLPTPEALKNEDAHRYAGGERGKEYDSLREQLQKEYGYDNAKDFHIEVWGSKWDIPNSESDVTVHDANNVTLSFASAWTPLTGLYEELVNLGFEVEAFYHESGAGFCGKFTNEFGDEYYEIEGNSAWVEENIPQDIDEEFAISQLMSGWEEVDSNGC